jgi:hypothetical protein
MTPEQEALYALQWNVPRSELSMAAQINYDRLRPAWERGEARPTAEEAEAARLAWEQEKSECYAGPVNGETVTDTLFWKPPSDVPGYDARQVDDLLRRVAAEIDAGRPAAPLIENATFSRRKYRSRYDIEAVDWFLGQILLAPDRLELAGTGVDPWRDILVAQFATGGVSGLAKRSPRQANAGRVPGVLRFAVRECVARLRPAVRHLPAVGRGRKSGKRAAYR